jgi:hypothetical protein
VTIAHPADGTDASGRVACGPDAAHAGSGSSVRCRICRAYLSSLFETTVLGRYEVRYYCCHFCGSIQTEEPYWLDEAYSGASTALDTGCVQRNLSMSRFTRRLLVDWFSPDDDYLDYGGGYGLFVRLMRDAGYRFLRQDPRCRNCFAVGFDAADHPDVRRYALVTALEVMEHVVDPMRTIADILSLTDSLLFTTELRPRRPVSTPGDWWYFTPETGQHVTFYSREALSRIAGMLSLTLYTDGSLVHLLTRRAFATDPLASTRRNRRLSAVIYKWARRRRERANSPATSLTQADHAWLRSRTPGTAHPSGS